MKIEKLPSGKYRIRQQYQGKRYSIVLDYKPTTKEATTLMAEKLSLSGVKSNGRTTVADAARQYIESRSNILSPTTLREYRRTNNYLLEQEPEFMTAGIDQIEQEDIQKLVNELAVGRSPKTVRNYYGFIASVFGSYRPNFHFRVDLPMKKKIDVNLPTEDDVRAILNYEEGSPFDVAFNLAVFGLRRSEVCALTMDDLDGNYLTISKGLVWTGTEWIVKDYPKTTESFRRIYLPDHLVEKIQKQGMYSGYITNLLDHLHLVQDKLGIKRFRFHDFRHFFASYAHYLGLSDADIMATGGWKTDYVMKSVYRHAMSEKTSDAQKRFAEALNPTNQI